jgi:hypothetical protein
MMDSTRQKEGFRHRLHQGLYRVRDKYRVLQHNTGIHSPQGTEENTRLASKTTSHRPNGTKQANSPASSSLSESFPATPSPPHGAIHAQQPNGAANEETENQTGHMVRNEGSFERSLTTDRRGNCTSSATVSTDIWSAAFREAVESLGEEIDVIALKGKSITQLFRDLEDIQKGETHDSAFLRGVKYLQSLRVPLETLKLALDLASPLSSLEPTAATVVGVIRSVVAVMPALEPIKNPYSDETPTEENTDSCSPRSPSAFQPLT